MSKNLNFECMVKEDINREFIDFLKDYSSFQLKQENLDNSQGALLSALIILIISEFCIYSYVSLDSRLKFMTMLGILIMGTLFCGKELFNCLESLLNKKQIKKDKVIMKERLEGWLSYMKEKENRFNIARNLINKIDSIENIKIANLQNESIDQETKVLKENIYKIFNKDFSENDLWMIDSEINKVKNLENEVMILVKQEQELKKIKNEMNIGLKSNINKSNSFKNTKYKKTFN